MCGGVRSTCFRKLLNNHSQRGSLPLDGWPGSEPDIEWDAQHIIEPARKNGQKSGGFSTARAQSGRVHTNLNSLLCMFGAQEEHEVRYTRCPRPSFKETIPSGSHCGIDAHIGPSSNIYSLAEGHFGTNGDLDACIQTIRAVWTTRTTGKVYPHVFVD